VAARGADPDASLLVHRVLETKLISCPFFFYALMDHEHDCVRSCIQRGRQVAQVCEAVCSHRDRFPAIAVAKHPRHGAGKGAVVLRPFHVCCRSGWTRTNHLEPRWLRTDLPMVADLPQQPLKTTGVAMSWCCVLCLGLFLIFVLGCFYFVLAPNVHDVFAQNKM
jgi:hypothetical protein